MTDHLQTHILSKFNVLKKIGSGAYGHVWKVSDNRDSKIKALKKNFDAFNNSTDAQRTYRQIMFLMQLSHPNIIKLQQVIRADNNNDIYLIFQHMDIDLFTLIRQGILQQKHKKWILYQIVKAMYYLHNSGLIHRDLKPSNILVNESCDVKLCDFGLVRSLEQENLNDNVLTQYIATRWYRAPQILVSSSYYSKAIDIWGFGCLLGQIFKGKPIFPGTSTINQMERIIAWTGFPKQSQIRSLKGSSCEIIKNLSHIRKINKKQFIPNIPELALDLMTKCMEFDPEKRIKIQQIMKHAYFKQFYNKNDFKTQGRKIKVQIDDNQRLNLKEYRNLIYQKIKSKDTQADRRQSVDKTLYRIRQASTKKHRMTIQSTQNCKQNQTIVPEKRMQNYSNIHKKISTKLQNPLNRYSNSLSAPKNNIPKKKSYSIIQKGQNLSKHLKTMQKQWNPIQTKKVTNLRQQMKKTKNILAKLKRSVYEVDTKKPKRILPTSSQNQNYQEHKIKQYTKF